MGYPNTGPWQYYNQPQAAQAPTQTQQPQAQPQNWPDYWQSMGAPDVPDQAFDSIRNSYFYGHVAPSLAEKGINLESARQEFMKQTERADKESFPRLETVGTSAVNAALKPITGLAQKIFGATGGNEAVEQSEASQAHEMQKQGISPAPYQWAGEMIGQAPYWMAGMGVAGEAGAALKAGKSIQKVINTIAGGLVQGSYDAASADKQPFIAGLKGAAIGAGMVGAFEGAGPLWKFLMSKNPEMTPEAAKAVENLTMGRADEAGTTEAAEAISNSPKIEDAITEWKKANQAAAKQNGVPQQINVAQRDPTTGRYVKSQEGKIALTINGADGKPYQLNGTADALINSPNLFEHLDAGGSIADINGDPEAANKFLLLNEQKRKANLTLSTPLDWKNPDLPADAETTNLPNDTIRMAFGRRDLLKGILGGAGAAVSGGLENAVKQAASGSPEMLNLLKDVVASASRNEITLDSVLPSGLAVLKKGIGSEVKETIFRDLTSVIRGGVVSTDLGSLLDSIQKHGQVKPLIDELMNKSVQEVQWRWNLRKVMGDFFPQSVYDNLDKVFQSRKELTDMSWTMPSKFWDEIDAPLKSSFGDFVKNPSPTLGTLQQLLDKTIPDYLVNEARIKAARAAREELYKARMMMPSDLESAVGQASEGKLQLLSFDKKTKLGTFLDRTTGQRNVRSISKFSDLLGQPNAKNILSISQNPLSDEFKAILANEGERLPLSDLAEYASAVPDVKHISKISSKAGRFASWVANSPENSDIDALVAFLKETQGIDNVSKLPNRNLSNWLDNQLEASKGWSRLRDEPSIDEQVDKLMRPSGMELARTPLGLGAEGKGGLMMRFATRPKVDELINARNSYYHATDLEGMRGILESGRIQASDKAEAVENWSVDELETEMTPSEFRQWKAALASGDDEASYKIQRAVEDRVEQQSADTRSGVSVSRTPRFLSKADKPITFVLDAEKMPSHRSFAEEGYGKSINSELEDQIQKLIPQIEKDNPNHSAEELREAALDLLSEEPGWDHILANQVGQRNPHFEFEQRTYNEPIDLSAVRGILVDQQALLGDTKNLHIGQEVQDHLASDGHLQDILDLAKQHNIPVKIFETGEEMHSYRAGLGKEPPERRWAVGMDDIPPLDRVQQGEAPESRLPTQNVARVRGSADPSLNGNGQDQASHLGERIAAKGGLDELYSSSSSRAMQTSGFLMQHNPEMAFRGPEDALKSQASGYMEGMPEEEARSVKHAFVREQPDQPIPGRSPATGMPGESFNQVKDRVLSMIQAAMNDWKKNPRKIGLVTHFTPMNLVDAWIDAGHPADLKVDVESYLRHKDDVGEMYKLAPRDPSNPDGPWHLRKVDIENDQKLPDAIYLMRHGETDWNPPSVKYKETPLVHRFQGDSPVIQGQYGGELGSPGEKPSVFLNDDAEKDVLFHENGHAGITALGIRKEVNDLLNDPIVRDIFHGGGFDPEAQSAYMQAPHVIPEEVYMHTIAAIRTGDEATLESFGAADTDKETVIKWATEKSNEILDLAAEQPDSLHKRTLERRLNAVVNRGTGQLEDIRRSYGHVQGEVDYDGSSYSFKEGDTTQRFYDREDLLNYLEENKQEPLLSPELIDTTILPDGIPRLARRVGGFDGSKPPITSDPAPPSLKGEKARPGGLTFSFFFRPSADWFSSVAKRFEMPELNQAWNEIDQSNIKYANVARPLEDEWTKVFDGVKEPRHTDFLKYFIADEETKPAVAHELKFTPDELERMARFQLKFADKIGFNEDELVDYLRNKAPLLKDGSDFRTMYDKGSTLYDLLETGALDPKDSDLARISHRYMMGVLTNQIVKPAVETMRELANHEDLGQLRGLINRKLDYILGRPDFTQEAVSGVVGEAIHYINKGMQSVRKVLPEGLHKYFEDIEDTPKEALDKYLLLSYAGSLALRPAVLVRNTAELFTTTFPVAGKHLFTGLREVFPSSERPLQDLVDQARQYGALIDRRNLSELYAGGGSEAGFEGKLEKLGTAALKYLQWSHNATRLVAFRAFRSKVLEAIPRNLEEPESFLRESGLWFAPEGVQKQYLREFSKLTPDKYEDFAMRASSKLVDLTQWNYRRGSMPGLYQYQLGRLFGQYGTWPLNYIEYGRRFLAAKDKTAALQGLTRLVLTHGAILSAGQGAGIDTSHWVFTGPAQWEGSPIFNAMIAAPSALGPGQRGAEARQKVAEVINPADLIPGAEELAQIYHSIAGNDQNKFIRMLGFTPVEGK